MCSCIWNNHKRNPGGHRWLYKQTVICRHNWFVFYKESDYHSRGEVFVHLKIWLKLWWDLRNKRFFGNIAMIFSDTCDFYPHRLANKKPQSAHKTASQAGYSWCNIWNNHKRNSDGHRRFYKQTEICRDKLEADFSYWSFLSFVLLSSEIIFLYKVIMR